MLIITTIFLSLLLPQTTAAQVCQQHPTLTRDLGNVVSFYKIFASDQEAADFYTLLDRDVISKLVGREPVVPINLNDPRYPQLKATIQSVKNAYDKRFPALKALPLPNVVLLPVNEPNAAAVPASTLSDNLLPNIFFINEGLLKLWQELDAKTTSSALTGLISHELAHMYFRHADPTIANMITNAYLQTPGEPEFLGFIEAFQQKQTALTDVVRNYQVTTTKTGPLSANLFYGIPVGNGAKSTLISNILEQPTSNLNCVDAKAATKNWLSFSEELLVPISLKGEVIQPTAEQLERGQLISKTLIASGKQCFANKQLQFFEAIASFLSLPIETAKAVFAESDYQKKYMTFANNMDALVDLFKTFDAERAALEAKIDMQNARIYGKEEEADDVSMIVETALAKESTAPGGNIETLFRSISKLSHECEENLAKDVAPNYGIFDDHHSTCYRIYHARKINKYFKECPITN